MATAAAAPFDPLPQSVLFCCDYNAVRSPMAEGILKKNYGRRIYVQSAGVKNELEIDGFSVADSLCFDIAFDDVVYPQVRRGAAMITVQTSNATYSRTEQLDRTQGLVQDRDDPDQCQNRFGGSDQCSRSRSEVAHAEEERHAGNDGADDCETDHRSAAAD